MIKLDKGLFKYYPVFWLAGVSAVSFHLIIILNSVKYLNKDSFKKIPVILLPLIVYVLFYSASVVLNSPLQTFDRIIASLYNLSFWIIGVLLVLILQRSRKEIIDEPVVKKGFAVISIIIFFTGLYCIFLAHHEYRIPSLLARFINVYSLPQLLIDSIDLKIFTSDWFDGGSSVRNAFLFPYATATAAVAMISFSYITLNEKPTSKTFLFWVLITFCCILSTYSRMLISLFLVYLLIIYVAEFKKNLRVTALILGLFLLIVLGPLIITIWNQLNELRSGSSAIRFLMYQATFDKVMNENPFYGVAVKERGILFIPLGSHSTYLGSFLKTGILGLSSLIVYTSFIIIYFFREFLAKEVNRNRVRIITMLTVMIPFWMFEDIDAAQMLSVCYFFILGSYLRKRKSDEF